MTRQGGMKDFFINLTFIDWIAYISAILIFISFLEKVFDVDFVGRRVFRLLWKVIKFLGGWLFMPAIPKLAKISESLTILRALADKGGELQSQLVEILHLHQNKEVAIV